MQKSLGDITEAEINILKDMAAVFFTPKEIAIVLEVDVPAFTDACATEGNELYNAFTAARLKSEFELRTSVVKLAKSGSSPAQTMSLEMVKTSQLKMMG